MSLFGYFKYLQRLGQVEDRLKTLERELKNACLDWDGIYDKVRKASERERKREERAAAPVEEPPTDEATRVTQILRRRYGAVLPR